VGMAWQSSFARCRHSLVSFLGSESGQGNTDFNGDGDAGDNVAFLYDSATLQLTNLGLATSDPPQIAPNGLVLVVVDERGQGNSDLNGDGDAFDLVLHLFDPVTSAVTNLGVVGFPGGPITAAFIAFQTHEFSEGDTDLNGDGDRGDDVVRIYHFADGTVTTLGPALANGNIAAAGNLVAWSASEAGSGHADFNGDGDLFDDVVQVYDDATGTIVNTGLANNDSVAAEVSIANGLVLFGVHEYSQGQTDLDGDGDVSGYVLHSFDPATGQSTNLGIGWTFDEYASEFHAIGPFVQCRASEPERAGSDLNGDHDSNDRVVFLLDSTGTQATSLRVALTAEPEVTSELMAFTVNESHQGATDLNGDGDAIDPRVLMIARLVAGPPCSLGTVNASAGVTSVLTLNGADQSLSLPRGTRLDLSLAAAPAGPAAPRYVVWFWPAPLQFDLPLRIGGQTLGCLVNGSPFHPGFFPRAAGCVRGGLPSIVSRGVHVFPSPPRGPWTLSKPSGIRAPGTFTFQGVVEDASATGPRRFSVTNAVTLTTL
jgi:hypothetical protein